MFYYPDQTCELIENITKNIKHAKKLSTRVRKVVQKTYISNFTNVINIFKNKQKPLQIREKNG